MGKLSGKKVIVTGGCRGIGKAIVKKCLDEGAVVVATYNKSKELAEELVAECQNESKILYVHQMDVTDSNQVKEVMNVMIDELGGVDVLVNNAGITKDSLLFMMSNDAWDKVIKTNLYGSFYTSKSVLLDMMSQKSGSIVNISSVSGVIGVIGQANYCASKFGLIGLTKTLAKELANKNIRVNAVAPGYIQTDMVEKMGKAIDGVMSREGSLKRLGSTEEIAEVVAFLASEESSYITGQVIVADGGIVG